MHDIHPLLGCQDTVDFRQAWRTGGVWRRTITLYVEDGALLTLHHAGRGISPGGWVLRHHDFTQLSREIIAGAMPIVTDSGIQMGRSLLLPPVRQCSLRLAAGEKISLLPASCIDRADETGLFGPLSKATRLPVLPELRQMLHCFAASLAGEDIDWTLWLGRGPGLTPSQDDMLIGMMLAAWEAGWLNAHNSNAFFRASGSLHTATTQVSANYLQYAARGCFASPLLHFVFALRSGRRMTAATASLLAMGHTSGADTLLGFWLAQHFIRG